MTIAIPAATFLPHDETPLLSSRRQDGWSAANQRLFLEAIAEGYGVEAATYRVGLSAASAYAFRRTAKGAAFALGWRAANLVARDAIAETLLVRALEGQVDTTTRADGSVVTRHRHDNGLALRMLARLDRQVEQAPDPDSRAARLIAQEFDAYMDLLARDEGPARAGLFLARRAGALCDDAAEGGYDLAPVYALAAADRLVRTGVATAAEVDIGDLDLADRTSWSAGQWQRAEAAGLLALAAAPRAPAAAEPDPPIEPQHCQHSQGDVAEEPGEEPGEEEVDPVWWDEQTGEWRTTFPPPRGFTGEEHGRYGDPNYDRVCDLHESSAMEARQERENEQALALEGPRRDAWFAQALGEEGSCCAAEEEYDDEDEESDGGEDSDGDAEGDGDAEDRDENAAEDEPSPSA